MVMRFLLKIIASAAALWVADYFLTGFTVMDGLWAYAVAGLILALLNTFLRPILRLFSLPFIWLTLGLFSLVINGFILWLATHLSDVIVIDGFLTLAYATIIVTLALALLDAGTSKE